jgi:hypothetical protein
MGAGQNVLKAAREGLQAPLWSALENARIEGHSVRRENIGIKADENSYIVNLEVVPLGRANSRPSFLVLFEDRERRKAASFESAASQDMARLRYDMAAMGEYLQVVTDREKPRETTTKRPKTNSCPPMKNYRPLMRSIRRPKKRFKPHANCSW